MSRLARNTPRVPAIWFWPVSLRPCWSALPSAYISMLGKSRPWPPERSSRCGLTRSTPSLPDSTPTARPWPKQGFDQVFVFALVKLHNQSDQPLYLRNAIIRHQTFGRDPFQLCGLGSGLRPRLPGLSVDAGSASAGRASICRAPSTQASGGGWRHRFGLPDEQGGLGPGQDLNVTFAFSYQPSLVDSRPKRRLLNSSRRRRVLLVPPSIRSPGSLSSLRSPRSRTAAGSFPL